MSAASPVPGPHELTGGASPAVVRRWLSPRDAERFLGDYRTAMDEARETLELGPVLDVVERWRRIAVLQTDPTGYRRTIRLAAELATGTPSPESEPLDVTSTKAGL